MLYRITQLSDPLCALVRDDPVRPEIPIEYRVSEHSEIFVLLDPDFLKPCAVVCVYYKDHIPFTVEDLLDCSTVVGSECVAVFYTIWSYAPGSGRQLIIETKRWIQENRSGVDQFVTLSPTTEQARKFHLRNGAGVFSTNPTTVNYIYNN